MHALGKHICTLLLACSLIGTLQAQDAGTFPDLTPPPDDYLIEQITAQDGLPASAFVVDIEQAPNGYLWMAVKNSGVFRYDGYTFTRYQHDPEDPTSLSSNVVERLHIDPKGTLWVVTVDTGLNRFDAETETFTRFQPHPDNPTSPRLDETLYVLTDQQGMLWVGTQTEGLIRFDLEAGTFTAYRHDPDDPLSLNSGRVNILYEDRQGTLWVSTGGSGLNRFHPETGTFTRYYHIPGDSQTLLNNTISVLHEDTEGTLWVGTWGLGLHTMDRQQGTFTRQRMDPQNPLQHKLPYQNAPPVDLERCEGLACGVLSFIHEDQSGNVWIGDFGAGLMRYNRATGAMHPYEFDPGDPHSLSAPSPWTIEETADGTLWVGTWNGLNKITPRRGQFRINSTLTNAFERAPDAGILSPFLYAVMGEEGEYMRVVYTSPREPGIHWIGADFGTLLRYDATQETLERIDLDPDRESVNEIVEDQEGYLWIGTQQWSPSESVGKLYRYDRTTGTADVFAHHPDDENSLGGGGVRALLVDRAGTLWVGTRDGGLNRFDPETETFTQFPTTGVSPLGSAAASLLYEDREGVFWVGTGTATSVPSSYVLHFDREKEVFMPQFAASPNAFLEDQAGQLWMGTWRGKGLQRIDRTHNSITPVDDMSGFTIKWLDQDDLGYLWVALQNTLARYDPEGGGIRIFGPDDGLPAGILSFTHTWTAQGEILFGYTDGTVMVFDPLAFEPNAVPPQVQITSLQASDTAINLRDMPVTLGHEQNDLAIEYVGLHYTDPSQHQYQYRLEPYETAWVDAGTQRTARYPNLPPGNYSFQVNASNSDGVWNDAGVSLSLVIRPPWWRTGWAYTLYALLLLAGIIVVDRLQRRRLIAQEREKTRERELAQAREMEKAYNKLDTAHTQLKATQQQLVQQEKMASLGQLTAGIAHEIKNPLNFINNFAEVNEELADELEEAVETGENTEALKEIIADLRQNAQVINQHGKRADGIVHAMMQHASGGTGQRETTDINALVSEHIDLAYHGKRAQVPDLNVEINRDLAADTGEVEIVPQEIGRVLLNLLGNAFDAVHAHALSVNGQYEPMITVSTRRVDGQVEIRVSDNGSGIPPEISDKIFEPFFTTKPTGSGTGLGLSLSYDIVGQGHSGMLTVESEEGEGATFIVTLPVNHTAAGSGA